MKWGRSLSRYAAESYRFDATLCQNQKSKPQSSAFHVRCFPTICRTTPCSPTIMVMHGALPTAMSRTPSRRRSRTGSTATRWRMPPVRGLPHAGRDLWRGGDCRLRRSPARQAARRRLHHPAPGTNPDSSSFRCREAPPRHAPAPRRALARILRQRGGAARKPCRLGMPAELASRSPRTLGSRW
jgi:hypothetical protein